MKHLVHLADYGRWPYTRTMDEAVTLEDAMVLQKNFHSLMRFKPVPLHIGFPMCRFIDGNRDSTVYGAVKRIIVRPDSLWVVVSFNDAREIILLAGEYPCAAAFWECHKLCDGAWHPCKLKSVGFTKAPLHPLRSILNPAVYIGGKNTPTPNPSAERRTENIEG